MTVGTNCRLRERSAVSKLVSREPGYTRHITDRSITDVPSNLHVPLVRRLATFVS